MLKPTLYTLCAVILVAAVYTMATRSQLSLDVVATLGVGAAVMLMAFLATRFSVRMQQGETRYWAHLAQEHGALYEQAAQAAGVEQLSASITASAACVTGLYQGYRISLSTAGLSDDNPPFTIIYMAGNVPSNWPSKLPYRRAAWKKLPAPLAANWQALTGLGKLMPEVVQQSPGRLALVPRGESWKNPVPKDIASYKRSLDALAAVVRGLDAGALRPLAGAGETQT